MHLIETRTLMKLIRDEASMWDAASDPLMPRGSSIAARSGAPSLARRSCRVSYLAQPRSSKATFRALNLTLSCALATMLALSMTPVLAQAVVDPSAIPVRAASASPAIGEEVLDTNGIVASAEFIENRTCTIRGCRSLIFDMRSGALIFSGGVWAPAFAQTGRGGQVVRVLPFAASERPGPAPDDKALETAPAIVKVTRAAAPKAE